MRLFLFVCIIKDEDIMFVDFSCWTGGSPGPEYRSDQERLVDYLCGVCHIPTWNLSMDNLLEFRRY